MLGAALVAALILGAATGPYAIAPGEVLRLMAARLTGTPEASTASTVLFNIRLPRVLAAALVGAALAGAGASYQTIFRNPLVSPDILGVSAGAGFGAVLGILWSMPVIAIQLMGFAGGLATVALVIGVATLLRGQAEVLVMVLTGIALGALASAGISIVKILADPDQQLPAITFWLLGSLAAVKPGDLMLAVLPVVAGLVPLAALAWRIGVMAMGEDEARALGVDTGRLRLVVILCATLVTATAVAIAGIIGWIGLMVPHMARFLVGARFDRLLPASLLIGATFLVLVDTAARSLATMEVPLGVLTALIGAPVFVWLLARGRREWA
ncbi:MAG TPA: iron ABC transporter permease [Rhodovulum sp.]|nr:iron ABC transporter permease [Rhodovulum sp.]HDR27627.1 iron ABC transporter permease [Rhodovulum sp.]